jgi:hypothetical protein
MDHWCFEVCLRQEHTTSLPAQIEQEPEDEHEMNTSTNCRVHEPFQLESGFYPRAGVLRAQFEERASLAVDESGGVTPFVYVFSRDKYQFLTTSAERIFSRDVLDDLIESLRLWSGNKLGTSHVSTPQIRLYLQGCWRRLVADGVNASWHYTLSLAPISPHLKPAYLKVLIEKSAGSVNGRFQIGQVVRSRLEVNQLYVNRVTDPYAVEGSFKSGDPKEGALLLDGYFW